MPKYEVYAYLTGTCAFVGKIEAANLEEAKDKADALLSCDVEADYFKFKPEGWPEMEKIVLVEGEDPDKPMGRPDWLDDAPADPLGLRGKATGSAGCLNSTGSWTGWCALHDSCSSLFVWCSSWR
jgi:hypothetical protein